MRRAALIILALVTVLGVGLWLSALNVQYRDIRYTVPFLIQLWMFATPFLAQNQLILMVLRSETVTAVQWATHIGAGFGLGAVLWLIAARLYHREQLAISA